MRDIQVAILAGGLATRLGDLTRNRPKSLLNIHGKPFLEYQFELLRDAGIRDVVLCVGHLGEQIEAYFGNGDRYGVSIRYSFEERPLGTAGALRNTRSLLDDTFFCMYGDSYVFLDFPAVMDYFESEDRLALMTVFRNRDRYGPSNTAIDGNLVTSYSKQAKSADMDYIDYGVNVFRKQVLDMVPEGQYYSLEDLFHKLIELNQFLAYQVNERFYEIGSPKGLDDFKKYIEGAG